MKDSRGSGQQDLQTGNDQRGPSASAKYVIFMCLLLRPSEHNVSHLRRIQWASERFVILEEFCYFFLVSVCI